MAKEVNLILEEFKTLGRKERAIQDQAYHKSKREHWGITVPDCKKFATNLSKELSNSEMIALAKALWETNLFDPMIVATKILSIPKLKPSKELWTTLIGFMPQIDGWALEDQLAHTAWKCILQDETLLEELEKWTKHDNFWIRRAALIYTLPYAKPGRNPERMLTWASSYASDTEWFIQKAIGWWLRDLSEHNPERVHHFLLSHWDQLKGVARKEATRKFNKEWQKI